MNNAVRMSVHTTMTNLCGTFRLMVHVLHALEEGTGNKVNRH